MINPHKTNTVSIKKMRPRLTPEPHNNTNTKLRDLSHRYKSKYDKSDKRD